jgi:DNA-binding XRE family transcriptional regulator
MKKRYQGAEFIKALRLARKITHGQFAKKLGVSRSTVYAWEAGETIPSNEAWMQLGNLAPYPDCIWFWEKAGLDQQVILAAAEKLLKDRVKEGKLLVDAGEVVLVPRVRETAQGREEAGPPIPLPTEFIPNPGSTICFVVDQKATAIVDSPKAVFILDESEKEAPNLLPFWGQVVFAEYDPEEPDPRRDKGIYVGRLVFLARIARGSPMPGFVAQGRLFLLSDLMAQRSPWLGYWASPSLGDLDDAIANDPNPDEHPLVIAARNEARDRALSELRLDPGWRILGRVLGRLKLEGVQNL